MNLKKSMNLKNFKLGSVTGISLLIALLVVIVLTVKSFTTIGSGERGAMFYKWGSGVDTTHVLSEGIHLIAPWNELIIYDVRQKKEDMSLSVLDKKGLTVKIDVTIQYHPIPNKIGVLDVSIGKGYKDVIVIPKSRSAIREVIGKYTAEELYSTKRAELQADCEKLISKELNRNNIILDAVNIRDVDLPKKITNAILLKQEQEQKNLRAEKLKKEAEYKAAAKIADAEGDKQASILQAQGVAESIKLKQKALQSSPQYVEYVKWKNFSEKGKSPYGENNIFGSNTAVVRGLK